MTAESGLPTSAEQETHQARSVLETAMAPITRPVIQRIDVWPAIMLLILFWRACSM